MEVLGLHHVSSITKDAGQNLQFYRDVLGLRLVKKTVNQDDPSMYHLFYADAQGTPGTDVTFFAMPYAGATRRGVPDIAPLSLTLGDEKSLLYWQERLTSAKEGQWAGKPALFFHDPEGLPLVLAAAPEKGWRQPWKKGPVPSERQITGLGAPLLQVREGRKTRRVLVEVLGLRYEGTSRIEGPDEAIPVEVFSPEDPGQSGVLLAEFPDRPRLMLGRGGVHHLAFAIRDEDYDGWVERLTSFGFQHSGPVDRFWFRSIYFREPGGLLFELATLGPGFARDEPEDHLGETLVLPPFLESQRAAIEAALPPLSGQD
ncbi:MAG: ring-cleaving dioxygenase [Bacillota bacterium]|nr:ring-cleaving dioxygenase [Bacillota bacterium]